MKIEACCATNDCVKSKLIVIPKMMCLVLYSSYVYIYFIYIMWSNMYKKLVNINLIFDTRCKFNYR